MVSNILAFLDMVFWKFCNICRKIFETEFTVKQVTICRVTIFFEWSALPNVFRRNLRNIQHNSHKKMFESFKDTQHSPSPLVLCCAKSGKAVPGSGGQEWTSKLETKFVTKCCALFLKIAVTRAIFSLPGKIPFAKEILKMFQNNKYFIRHFFDNIDRYIIIPWTFVCFEARKCIFQF